ncbi:MAG: KpsF/GutQ family sugar-phosphate isomerase [Thermodesulfobacteriota bacterium]
MSISLAKEVIKIEAEGINSLLDQIGPEFDRAIDIILSCPSRVIITGIGKSGIIGQKISATLNSTGTSSFFLHPVEALHGDLGLMDADDVVIAISYSGETSELTYLMPTLQKRGAKTIALTGNPHSTLANYADVVLSASIPREACPLGLAPTTSTTAALVIGDALAVVLLDRKNFAASDFRKNHPGGSLGERLKVMVKEVMLSGDDMPVIKENRSFREAVEVLNDKNLGAVIIKTTDNKINGIITDGDIRRLMISGKNFLDLKAADIMTADPKTIDENLLAADALSIMQRHEVTILPVCNKKSELTGILHLHDLLGKGEFRLLV